MQGYFKLFSLFCLLFVAIWSYKVKYDIRQLSIQKQQLRAEIATLSIQRQLLRAEWAHLINPRRLESLVKLHHETLGLSPPQAKQLYFVDHETLYGKQP